MLRYGFLLGLLLIFAGSSKVIAQQKGKIAPELAGKWCYYNMANGDEGKVTNTCVTLNDDGTYEFFLDGTGLAQARSIFPGVAIQETDYGDWWIEGNKLYYRSPSHGSGAFQFQKMNQPPDQAVPMIVLSGQAFVSVSSKDPW